MSVVVFQPTFGFPSPAPFLLLHPAGLDFWGVSQAGVAQSAELLNAGAGADAVSSVSITGPNASSFGLVGNTCGSSITAGTGCSIDIVFSPGQPGILNAELVITDNAPGSPHVVALSGGENPVPVITSISPPNTTAGAGDFTLTVNGSGFVYNSYVVFNGKHETTTFVSPFQLTASITAADIAAAGSTQETVFNLYPRGGSSNAVTFQAR